MRNNMMILIIIMDS